MSSQTGLQTVLWLCSQSPTLSDDFLGSIVLFNIRGDKAEVGFWLAPWDREERCGSGSSFRSRAPGGSHGAEFSGCQDYPDNEASRRTLLSANHHQVGEPQTVTALSGAVVTALTFELPVVECRFNV